jgi:hypothetical protein
MRSGCDRAADMILIRTGRRRFFGIDDADQRAIKRQRSISSVNTPSVFPTLIDDVAAIE